MRARPASWLAMMWLAAFLPAAAPVAVGDTIPAPLTDHPADPARGRALVLAREVSTCLLCHAMPLSQEPFQGSLGPSLAGVGARLTMSQIRLRIVDDAAVNPETVMPRFFTTTGLVRVGTPWQGRPVLDAQQIEDIVAYLATLRTP